MATFKIRRRGQATSPSGSTPKQKPAGGVGTELKAMLDWMKKPSGPCKCDQRAAELDRLGIDWCDQNRDVVVCWLRDGAAEVGVPFHELPARWAIHIAINRARAKVAAQPL